MTVQLYCGDCLDVLPTLAGVDALISDPPYGISARTNYRERKRGALAPCNNFAPIVGDDRPFDPAPLLRFPLVVLFGANHYAGELPGGAWHVWDKVDGLPSCRPIGFNDNSDCEFIWANRTGAARIFRHRWMGAMKASEHSARRVHPTQKPIDLLRQIIEYYTRPGDTVCDPYMGSGTTGIAAVQAGRNFIGIEIDPDYFEIARQRIEQAQPALLTGAAA